MPEGPSIKILQEEVQFFTGLKPVTCGGNAKIDMSRFQKKPIRQFKSWGKHLLICYDSFFLRIHLLLFGSYRINEKRDMPPRLFYTFKKGELNFYNCSVKLIDGSPEEVYDWEIDTLSDSWNPHKALLAVKDRGHEMVCDLLLDQQVFAGSGNIIKNEVLFKQRIHPESITAALTLRQQRDLITALHAYCYDFYRWKKAYVFKRNWLIYRAKICSVCGLKITRRNTGKNNRRSFYCAQCQPLYTVSPIKKQTKSKNRRTKSI
jgi:endonuclease-8